MKKRGKLYLCFFCTVLAVLLCLGMIYSWLAYRPTGYGEIAERAEESVERIKPMMALRPPKTLLERTARHGPADRNPASLEASLSEWHSLWRQGSERLSYQDRETSIPSKVSVWLWGARRWASVLKRTCGAGVIRDETGNALARIPADCDVTQSVRHATEDRRWFALIYESGLDLDLSILSKANWPVLINTAEEILLRLPETADAIPEGLADSLLDYSFQDLAFLAVARAAYRGQGDEASHMLDRLLETVRVSRLTRFPESISLHQVERSVFALGQMASFPVAAIRNALRICEDMILPPERYDDFHNAHLAKLKRDYELAWNPGYLPGINRFDSPHNIVHYFWDGRVENAWQGLLRPVADGHVERFIKAYSEGDRDRMKECVGSLYLTLEAMNTSWHTPSHIWHLAVNRSIFDPDRSLTGFNAEARSTCVSIASVLYYRERGEWPASLDSLFPEYLRGAIEDYAGTDLFRAEPTEPVPLEELPSELREAAQRYVRAYKKPEDPELKSVQGDCGGFAAQTPVFCWTRVIAWREFGQNWVKDDLKKSYEEETGRELDPDTQNVETFAQAPILPHGFTERLAKLLDGLENAEFDEKPGVD